MGAEYPCQTSQATGDLSGTYGKHGRSNKYKQRYNYYFIKNGIILFHGKLWFVGVGATKGDPLWGYLTGCYQALTKHEPNFKMTVRNS
jgi:hypothetical protein|tara:strand:+ start:168 stop:431 length:264 start_codon:yes stop_codon:yes gene_type:complete